jgi:hypothetical protein
MNIQTIAIIIPILALLLWQLIRNLKSTIKNQKSKVEFSNIAEGSHVSGQISKLADGAIATRFFVVKIGSDADHVTPSASNADIPLGICTDEAAAAEDLVNVALLGAAPGTLKAVAKSAIAVGDFIHSNGDGKVISLKATSGTFYIIGRALQAAAADGDIIEFDPSFPIQRIVP